MGTAAAEELLGDCSGIGTIAMVVVGTGTGTIGVTVLVVGTGTGTTTGATVLVAGTGPTGKLLTATVEWPPSHLVHGIVL